jgi:hypothetical protein
MLATRIRTRRTREIAVRIAGRRERDPIPPEPVLGVQPLDASTLAALGGVMPVMALLASYVPVRRASGVDPMESPGTESGIPALLKWSAKSRRLPGTVMPQGRPKSS